MSALDHPQQEEAVLELFLHRIRPRLRALFSRYRIPLEDTEDILQQALLALLYQWQTVRDPEAWLLGTLRNRCLLYWRDRRRQPYAGGGSTGLALMGGSGGPPQGRAHLARDLPPPLGRPAAR